ncbi:polysaccharide deacetylase family protein [Rossellomorea aquimaris]|uniref:Polysaccharide deacetylase n=1 Tax=Rossellomorea aquimaris TaxID=189382 RepID=A0A5D4TRV3_9BACI|nr:polysaccharide deacetylase family protein [Rossellomorea aquimaris]TYS76806.1 polysaccharide deacetylase [Rossellomorea aquimaris]TYS83711.1 polysaccharide deacetylase [Rossellomorea aquimaris]
MGRQRKKRKWIKPIELGGLAGVIVLLLILSTSWVLDIGEAKISKETTTQQNAVQEEPSEKEEGESGQPVVGDDSDTQEEEQEANFSEAESVKDDNYYEEVEIEDHSTNVNEQGNFEDEKTVYITFDDGPNENTGAILKVLNQYGAKASFFMLEPNMKKHSEAVRQIVEEGHSVGLHGVTHDVSEVYQSSESVVGEMLTAQSTLESITGIRSELIRVPYGSVPNMKPEYLKAVKREGFRLWDWNVDSEDWKFHSGEYVQNVMDQLASYSYENQPKVILIHEKPTTLAYLDSLLKKLKDQGYNMKTLTEEMDPVAF